MGAADAVKLTSARGSLVVAVAADATVPAGTITMRLAQGDPSPTVLIDAAAPVTEVRLETTT